MVVLAADPRPVFGQVERWVDAIDLVIGSSSAIMACGAARLGLRVAMAGLVGDDALGRFMVAALTERGVETAGVRVDPGAPTGAGVILSDGRDRAILTAPGTIPRLRAADVPRDLLARARHVHVGGIFLLDDLRPDLAGLLREARAAGATTSADTNWDPRGSWDGGIREILAAADVVLPNAAEAAHLTGLEDPEAAAAALLALGSRVAAVKLGTEGALALAADGSRARVPAIAVETVDTTGAGDSFDAGFLAAWLGGRALADCLAVGAACGALSTRGAGGTVAQPTLAEAEAVARAAGLLR